MRSRKQHTIAFVAEREATEFNCLTYTRGDDNLVFDDLFIWAKVAADETCEGIS
jgi:hypothetical protein